MSAALLLVLLNASGEAPAIPSSPPAVAGMVVGEPPLPTARSEISPEVLQHEDGGVSIVFPEGYLMRTTLRRGFNGVWFTDCGAVPTTGESQR